MPSIIKPLLWEQIKELEQRVSRLQYDLGHITATLLVLFGEDGKQAPNLIHREDSTIDMLMKVFNHYAYLKARHSQMKQISLTEKDFKALVNGKVVEKGNVKILLSDIGYDRMVETVRWATKEFIGVNGDV